MRILWAATKAPWPPVDGGRLLMDLTLEALADLGHRITVTAPTRVGDPPVDPPSNPALEWRPVPTRRRSKISDLLAAWPRGRSFSMARHGSRAVADTLRGPLAGGAFDVVHVEQVHALGHLPADLLAGTPVVLRAQNVESDLWRSLARARPWAALPAVVEARLLARAEADAVRFCAAVAALTAEDAEALSRRAGGTSVDVIPPPFPGELPASDRTLEGDPALVVLGSSGWLPNLQGVEWLLREIWPAVAEAHPEAVLHVFGPGAEHAAGAPRVVGHDPPAESRDAFAPGSILAVPLHMASGIRMKILEAWARGVPTIATPTAAAGLAATDGKHLREASTPEQFIAAVDELRRRDVYAARVEAGRDRLRRVHDPRKVAERWVELYESARAGR